MAKRNLTKQNEKVLIMRQVDAYNARLADPVTHLTLRKAPGGRGYRLTFVEPNSGEVFEFDASTLRDAGQVVGMLRAVQANGPAVRRVFG